MDSLEMSTINTPLRGVCKNSLRVLGETCHRLRIVMAFLMTLLLGGCIDYDEEMWLNADLSGRLAMNISIREELVKGRTGFEKDMSEDGLRRDVERIPGVKLESFESFRDAGRVIVKVRITFDSVEKLTRHETGLGESSPMSLLGAVTLHEERGKLIFDRVLRASPTMKAQNKAEDMMAKGLGSLLFSKNYLAYKLHVPNELITANSQHINDAGRTVEWKFTLAQAMREPPDMHVEWKKPLGLGLWVAIGGGTLLVLVLAFIRKPHRA